MTTLPDLPDAWRTDDGFPEEMDLTIHTAYFATDANYQNGRVYQLCLIGSDEQGEPQEIKMSAGSDWTSPDGGATIVHPSKRRINKSSIYGRFIDSAIECPERVNGKLLIEELLQRGDPMTAAIWIDLVLHLDRVEIKFGKNLDPVQRLLPTHYLGVAADTPAQATIPPVPTQPPAVPPTPPPVPRQPIAPDQVAPAPVPAAPSPSDLVAQARAQAAVSSNGSPLYQEMLELAKAHTDHNAFMEAAFGRADVLADEELAIQVADPAKLWALAKA